MARYKLNKKVSDQQSFESQLIFQKDVADVAYIVLINLHRKNKRIFNVQNIKNHLSGLTLIGCSVYISSGWFIDRELFTINLQDMEVTINGVWDNSIKPVIEETLKNYGFIDADDDGVY